MYDLTVPANIHTSTPRFSFSTDLLFGAWRRLSPGSSLADRLLFVLLWSGLFGNRAEEEEALPHDCEAPAPLNLPGSSFISSPAARALDGEVKDGRWRGRRRL